MEDSINKKKVQKFVKADFKSPPSQKDELEESYQKIRWDYIDLIQNSMSEAKALVRERALLRFFELHSSRPLKGSFRAKRRQLERWLDKQDVKIEDNEENSNFVVTSSRLRCLISVDVEHDKKAKKLKFSFR